MRIAEVFGYDVADNSVEAWSARHAKHCKFRNSPCTKASISDPLGICTLADGGNAASLCPVRFLEQARIFKDAATIAFGEGTTFGIFPEIRILEIASSEEAGRSKKIGKVDFLIGKIDEGVIIDFAAVEIQAAYFSGNSLRPVFDHYMATRSMEGVNSKRRPDFRSCAQKRLVPQLQLKIPVFRRWGKKFLWSWTASFLHPCRDFPKPLQAIVN